MGQTSRAGTAAADRGLGSMLLAAGFTTFGPIPAFFLGSLAVLVRRDLGLSEARLGFTVAVFFAAAAVGSAVAGPFSERLGARRTLRAGLATSVLALAALAVATAWWQLPLALAVAGVGHAVLQVGANHLLAGEVPLRMQGLAFGIKQSTVPGATLVAGAAVPLLGVTLGWRWSYGLAALTGVTVLLVETARRRAAASEGTARRSRPAPRQEAFTRPELYALALAAGLAAAAANTLPVFVVAFAVDVGIPVGQAGVLLAVASGLGLGARVLLGRLADVSGSPDISWVALLLLTGCLAFGLLPLAYGLPALLWLAAALGYAGGWGWPGLLTFIVVRQNRHAPASATGLTQSGVFAGAVVGPLLFGLAVSAAGYSAAWWGAGAAQLFGAAVLTGVRRRRRGRLVGRSAKGAAASGAAVAGRDGTRQRLYDAEHTTGAEREG